MVIGKNKKEVIENIKINTENNELNKKVEVNDPVISDEEKVEVIEKFYKNKEKKMSYFLKNKIGYLYVNYFSLKLNKSIEIEGLENIKDINSSAIITTNHFNPLDNMVIRKLIKKRYKKNMYIVIQETNLLMPGFLGFLMNNLNILPLSKSPNYIIKKFKPELSKILSKNNYVLIYPEEEMWFNYKKPRPCKRGSYQFAAENNVPIISCFVEQIDTKEKDNDEFNKINYIVHVLKPIYPDKTKTPRENSIIMAQLDYQQKVQAYEKAYNTKLSYDFSYDDIVGYRK